MQHKTILNTQRLSLREFDLHDSEFILKLVNSENWLQFIGDKGVRTDNDAKDYLKNGPLKSYKENGYGLWLVAIKESQTPIGMCGLVNRATLDHTDIGFAMLPNYMGQGYGYEIANATMNFAKNSLNLKKVIAITDPNNHASIKLLNKIGLDFERTLDLSENDSVLLFSPNTTTQDRDEINTIASSFFNLFTNVEGNIPNLGEIKNMFISNGIITNNTSGLPIYYDLENFIDSRKQMLIDGTLTNFIEGEISHKTEVYRNIAHRFSFYKKSGTLKGVHFENIGMKTIQFIKANGKWKISSVAWSDEH
ncbi:GNAT family N-acetyltransferase [Aquimarina sp. AU474]|uniref:GNAT family N-acetyltransferase n=1 Tax=Aquimarina sp. AU474 TaxID=2108529 RepID=UPI000D695522|nr:GNAT family N-acetyltransferase [Aquimarina sp. AU474]